MKTARIILLSLVCMICSAQAEAADIPYWRIMNESGSILTEITEEPHKGDQYITADNVLYEIEEVTSNTATAFQRGSVALPSLEWMDAEAAVAVAAMKKRIALYCTHSDESYQASDGYYTTTDRGSIYEIAHALSDALAQQGIEAVVSDQLHHPHDAGAYRRSRQTAVELLKTGLQDALIDIHRDGIPDPASYEITIGGKAASKIRLLVGRGNQNAELNKDFALLIKAVADRVYPGLIKDIYMGKGAFNQDLLPQSILFECGTYTLEKERVLVSMPMLADVLDRALYGGVIGSAGRISSDVSTNVDNHFKGEVVVGKPDAVVSESKPIGSGIGFLAVLLIVGIGGIAFLSTGSLKGGAKKAARNISEMTGGLLGKKPKQHEDHEHS